MEIIHTIEAWQACRDRLSSQASIGFVPTMGCLHAGHAELIKTCVLNNQYSALSIFVNPTQFNEITDYQSYPTSKAKDLQLAKKLGIDYVLMPTQDNMYPKDCSFQVDSLDPISRILEGQYRPDHFQGVLTIVLKLLMLVRPTRAYFGHKDYQQYQLVKKLAKAFFLTVDIIGCPTVRTDSQLAYSSRNSKLSAKEKHIANQFASIFHSQSCPTRIKAALTQAGIQFDYVEAVEDRLFAAVWIGKTRLIDNRPLPMTPN